MSTSTHQQSDTVLPLWTADRVRQTFFEFFQQRSHVFVSGSSVVPQNDPTLLFTNAGMNQFKPVFLGDVDAERELGTRRAVNVQKCIRAGGKHNELEDVGKDSYHHSFFEMLGNWSFGEYFRKDALVWAWQLLTEVYGLDPNRLYVTYYEGDPSSNVPPDLESRDIWLSLGVPSSRILTGTAKDNFWEMGRTGPCGPSSEIHYDLVGGRDASALVNQDDPTVIEIWNVVFVTFSREEDRSLTVLKERHVDTGMGLERLVCALQGVRSNYDTDLFKPLLDKIQELVGPGVQPYRGRFGEDDEDGVDTAYRIVADHARTLTIALADGCIPDNVGRGYVVRRILRRGIYHAQKRLSVTTGSFFGSLVPTVVELLQEVYPGIASDVQSRGVSVILDREETMFAKTLGRGERMFTKFVKVAKERGTNQLSGEETWKLYESFGFPTDLTRLMAEELGMTIDEEGVAVAQERSREASRGKS